MSYLLTGEPARFAFVFFGGRMAADINPSTVRIDNDIEDVGGCDLHTFKLYETRSVRGFLLLFAINDSI